MKKMVSSSSSIKKYNKLFKFLTFDLSLDSCLIMTMIILACMLFLFGFLKAINAMEQS
jgi:hypothetical protein